MPQTDWGIAGPTSYPNPTSSPASAAPPQMPPTAAPAAGAPTPASGSPAPSPGSGGVGAPTAPGRLGVPIDASAAQTYLLALRQWVIQRRSDLDAVDRALLRLTPAEQSAATTDLTVALTFWKAINDRLVLLETTFDGGRVGPKEAERLSTLVHGRLDSNTEAALSLPSSGSLSMSLPEATRLLDSLVKALMARAQLTPGAAEAAQRIQLIRASVERVRDQLPLVPAGSERDGADRELQGLDRRVADLIDRARRGADVGGLLGPIEIEVASLERDLIVASAERAQAAKTRASTEQQVDELEARADAIRALEKSCVEAVDPAPHLAVPNVRALGPVPQGKRELDAFRAKLDRVAQALDQAHEAYAAALAVREEVLGTVGALGAMAASASLTPDAQSDLDALRARLDEVTASKPMPVLRARALAAAYESYVYTATQPTQRRKATP